MSSILTIEFVKTFYNDFLTATDLDAFSKKYIADAIVWENFLPSNIPFGGSFPGVGEYLRYMQIMLSAIEIENFDITNILVDGDSAVIFGTETSLVRSTGKRYTMDWVHVVKFDNGIVVYAREYNDTAAMKTAFS